MFNLFRFLEEEEEMNTNLEFNFSEIALGIRERWEKERMEKFLQKFQFFFFWEKKFKFLFLIENKKMTCKYDVIEKINYNSYRVTSWKNANSV